MEWFFDFFHIVVEMSLVVWKGLHYLVKCLRADDLPETFQIEIDTHDQ
jgi:hypothetical protein